MQLPETLCGVDLLFAEWVAIAAYLALGIWMFARWACRDEKAIPNWRWGDPVRRPGKSFEARVLEHLGGIAVFLSISVFGLHGLGIW
jgi:hypothetical protein